MLFYMEPYILLIVVLTMEVKRMLSTLKRLNHNYDSFTIKSFFGSKLGRLLYSSLGLKTVRDLVNVLVKGLCTLGQSKVQTKIEVQSK